MREPDAELDQLARLVIGAAIEVHKELGPGFLEKIYEEALCRVLDHMGIPYERQFRAKGKFRGEVVGEAVFDLLVAGRLIVELKSAESLHPTHVAQTISYLKTVGEPFGVAAKFSSGKDEGRNQTSCLDQVKPLATFGFLAATLQLIEERYAHCKRKRSDQKRTPA